MTRQNINIGSSANDGTGDTLRTAGTKINQNLIELYTRLGGDSATLSTGVSFTDSAVVFEGASTDSHETFLIATDPTADRTISLPNATGTVVLKDTTDTLTNKTLTAPIISTISNTGTITLPTSTDTLVGRATTDTLTNKTLTSPTIYRPKIQQSIIDSAGATMINLTSTSSAVNNLKITNQVSGSNPTVQAEGTDTNINLKLNGQGKGSVEVAKLAYTSVTETADGAVDSAASLIVCNKSGSLALALGPGTTAGEFKIFTNIGTGTATITPHPFAQGTSFDVTQNNATQCIWNGTSWFMLAGADSASTGVTIT